MIRTEKVIRATRLKMAYQADTISSAVLAMLEQGDVKDPEKINAALYQRDLLKAAVRTLDWVLLQSDKPT